MNIKVVCRRRISRFLITGVIGLAASLPVQGQGSPLSLNQAGEVLPTETTLTAQERAMVAWVDERKQSIITELSAHVNINTGTANIEGIDRYRTMLEQELAALGFTTKTHSSVPIDVLTCEGGQVLVADHLTGVIRGGDGPRVLINGHMDTVFSATDEFQSLQISDDGVLKGPGVADMKGGIVVMLNALRALSDQGLLEGSNLTVLFNSDEEIGSLGSRSLIESLAGKHDIGLVFEGTYGSRVTRARKGLGQARLKVTGRESHAGGAHQDGVSANLELAHKIIEIEGLTDYAKKLTVNTGVMNGGEKRNTVPGCADAYVDMRFPAEQGGEYLKAEIERIANNTHTSHPQYPGLPRTESWAVLHRPSKPQHAEVDKLISEAMGISILVGEPITGTRYSGGGTDGSIAQGVGLPTMDSLGLDGTGAHSSREASSINSLIERTKLAAILLARQLHEK